MRCLPLCIGIALVTTASVCAKTYGFDDARKVVSVYGPQISPDGTQLAYIRSRADFTKDRSNARLMLADLRTLQARPLTFERRGLSTLRWSPDGKRLAFLASTITGKSTQGQIFVMRLDGGDAQQVTAEKNGVDNFVWSPDGKQFAYATQASNPNQAAIDKHLDGFEVGDNDYLVRGTVMPSHLWLVSASGGRARQLTNGEWSLGIYDPGGGNTISWSADGKQIAVEHFPNALNGDALPTVVDIVDVHSGALHKLSTHGGLEGAPQFAPVGNAIAYKYTTGGFVPNGSSLYVTHPGGGSGVSVRNGIDRDVRGYTWDNSGEALWIGTDYGASSVLWYRPIHGCPVRINLGELQFGEMGNVAHTGALAFTASSPSHPGDVYVLPNAHAKPIRVTHENGFIDRLQHPRVTSIDWTGPNGFREDGVLTYPVGFVAHEKYPLALMIHGGPQSASTLGWINRRQLFAAHGYLVFEPNYRGSTNLGDKYQAAIDRDAGDGPGKDVMAGIAAVRKLGIVDDSRIAVTGWSYGGYMTSWLIGHYHIWKAAMAGAAVTDYFDDYNISFYVHTDQPYFPGSPWDPKATAMWRDQSPITYASDIRTPTLIMGDIGDNNVPITNSFKLYHALKDNGVPVEFWAYPVAGHFPGDPVRTEDVNRRWLAWLDTYLGGKQL